MALILYMQMMMIIVIIIIMMIIMMMMMMMMMVMKMATPTNESPWYAVHDSYDNSRERNYTVFHNAEHTLETVEIHENARRLVRATIYI